ncbi:glycosyltransferase family 4 protein [Poseidonibacter ostreae]|uniref:Glycosyltransferase n=1 Tax=Poseidonibacter ostreae TaxID=2654171 RepID=A0A6L4WUB3_9BACT|nr:glycosyltransferase family 4 protein [Poseidonibacter ostreae]KAB7889883.1 glycosyltransferase [Poseidonibacter ostreae]KAB7890204.1 glycosyltransferase [Poseidonibacter ostreae]
MESEKTICIINHYAFPYGYGFHTRQHTIAKILKNLGHNVTIISSSFNHLKIKAVDIENIYKEEIHDDIKYIWIKTKEYQGNGLARIKNLFEFSKKLNKIYKKLNITPDIVWVSSPQPFSIYNGIKMKDYFKCKFVYEERDIWPLTLQMLNGINKYNPLVLIFRYLQLQAYKKSDIIVSPLDNLKEFVEKSGFPNKKVEYLPQPFVEFEIEEFDINLPKDKFIVGYLGSIGDSNSVFNLVKAANLLKKRNDIYFVMVGDGPQLDELKEFSKNNDLTNIEFLGKLEKKKAMYFLSQCSILYKGNPDIELYKYGIGSVKLVEYLWFNKPIINATNIKNDLVSLSNTGLVIESEDSNKLKNSIKKLADDKELYQKYLNNGKKFVEEKFTEKWIQEKLYKIMEGL